MAKKMLLAAFGGQCQGKLFIGEWVASCSALFSAVFINTNRKLAALVGPVVKITQSK